MERRYQVFISSTYIDLKSARNEVSEALLRADCFPAGMELFPATDEEQFKFIKSVIDQSDYYIVITAGRYGSLHPDTGISFTEMEYDYAVSVDKPVIRLLHRDPFNELKGELIEQNDKGRKLLIKFRKKLTSGALVRFWSDPKELGTEVLHSLNEVKKRYGSGGWVRYEESFGGETTRLQGRIEEVFREEFHHLHNLVSRLRVYSDQLHSKSEDFAKHFNLAKKLDPVAVSSDDPNVLFSPMVGTVYLSPEPGGQNFVSIGQKVTEGDTLMVIEAMKTMNQIPAHKSGVVSRVFPDDGMPVEFGVPLVLIES